jgi:hypothetical protein
VVLQPPGDLYAILVGGDKARLGREKLWSCSSELVGSGILECCGGGEIPNGEKLDIDDWTLGEGNPYPLLTRGKADVPSPMVLLKEDDAGGGEKKRGGGGDVA